MNPGSGLLRGRRILVVEDEVMVSMMLDDLLTSAGCVVIGPAGTTVAALALIEQEDVRLTYVRTCQRVGKPKLDGC